MGWLTSPCRVGATRAWRPAWGERRRKVYGPYHQWTWKQEGKTVTVNLSASQARVFQRAIDNHRKLAALVGEMRTLSRQILEATTVGVKKRKPRAPPDIPTKLAPFYGVPTLQVSRILPLITPLHGSLWVAPRYCVEPVAVATAG